MNDARFLRADTIMQGFPRRRRARSPWSPPRTSCGRCSARGSTSPAGARSPSRPRRPTRRRSPTTASTTVLGVRRPAAAGCLLGRICRNSSSPPASKLLASSARTSCICRRPTMFSTRRRRARRSPMRSTRWSTVMSARSTPPARSSSLTADHGMNDKHLADGSPDVLYLQDSVRPVGRRRARRASSCRSPTLTSLITARSAPSPRSICRKTSMARRSSTRSRRSKASRSCCANARKPARFELPPDRIGDLVVLSTRHKVLGTSADRHDLSGLTEPLRSHGGLTEQTRADDRQPQDRLASRPRASKLRCLRRRPQPCGVVRHWVRRSHENTRDREVNG